MIAKLKRRKFVSGRKSYFEKYNIQDKEVFFYCDEILSQEADFWLSF